MERNPPISSFKSLLSELAAHDNEHGDVSVTHETEWCLSVSTSMNVIWENLEGGPSPRHMKSVGEAKILELWTLLAKGDIKAIDREAWEEGYPA